MNATKLGALIGMVIALTACGGGGDYDHRMTSVLGTYSQERGFDSMTSPPAYDAQESISAQLQGDGDIAIQIPPARDGNFRPYLSHLVEATKHKDRIKWFYVKDEMFYSPVHGVQIGQFEDEITEAALTVKWYGLKSAVSMLPDVILSPAFKMKNINAFDVIAIDVYPSNITSNLGCDPVTNNPGSNLLYCSYQKLRALGFTGEVWYIYQAFGNPYDSKLREHLEQQRETIKDAPSIGVTGLVSFGLDMPATYEAPLYGLKGTNLENLVTCSDWCTQASAAGINVK